MNVFDTAKRAVTVLRNANNDQQPAAIAYAELARRYVKKAKISEESRDLLLHNIDTELNVLKKPFSQGWYYQDGQVTDLSRIYNGNIGLAGSQYAGGLPPNSCQR
jgi:hypothetical protein